MLTVLVTLALLLVTPAAAWAGGTAAEQASTTDALSQGIVAAIILAVFTLLAVDRLHRVLVVMGGVALMWAVTYFTPFRLITFSGVVQAVDVNVLFLLASMMAMVGVLKTTGVFEWLVVKLMNHSRGDPYRMLYVMVWFTGTLSAVCDNVTTVIFVTPMAYQVARAMALRPMALLLPVIIASNVGGTATLIGDPPNIMIGSGAGISFLAFLLNLGPPVIVMMFAMPRFAAWYFRSDYDAAAMAHLERPVAPVPAIADPLLLRWSLWISAGVFAGFLTHGLTGMPTAVPATIGAGALLIVQDMLYLRTHRPTHEERQHGLLAIIEKEIEWATLTFFGFLFIAVGAAVQTGLIDTLARGLVQVIGTGSTTLGLGAPGTLLFAALLICWVSGVVSAIVDNIPFVAVMIPITHRLLDSMPGDAAVLWWALALGACLGGNATPVGASANVTVLGIAERLGARASFHEFVRFGAPVTVMTLSVASLYLASYVYLGPRQAPQLWALVALLLLTVRTLRSLVTRAPAGAMPVLR